VGEEKGGVVLLHIDLFSFSWLQVCLNKFISVQREGVWRETWAEKREGRGKAGEAKSRGGKGGEGLCILKIPLKSPGPGPLPTLRQIDTTEISEQKLQNYRNAKTLRFFIEKPCEYPHKLYSVRNSSPRSK